MSRRRRRKSGSTVGLILGAIGCILLSVGIVGGYLYLKNRAADEVALDQTTLCPVDGPRSVTAVLLDVTDPISDTTAADLRNEFQALVYQVPIGGLIQVYALTEREGELAATFSGCNPGAGKDVDEWTRNPRLAQERWEKAFQEPLEEISKRLREGANGQFSPIMAGIQQINLQAFSVPKHQGIPRSLVIASDMVEHTNSFSMYKAGASYPKYEQSGAPPKFRTPLDDIEVRVLEFQRSGLKFSDEDLSGFWNRWISSNSGVLVSFKRLQGII